MSELTPVSRTYLQTLKAKKDEEQRQMRIKQTVQSVYSQAIHTASQATKTSFEYQIGQGGIHNPFQLADVKEIIGELETLFPDCSVKYTQMAQGRDGKLYDVSSLDDKLRPLLNLNSPKECIVVDWS
jgi:hypothetical protein